MNYRSVKANLKIFVIWVKILTKNYEKIVFPDFVPDDFLILLGWARDLQDIKKHHFRLFETIWRPPENFQKNNKNLSF